VSCCLLAVRHPVFLLPWSRRFRCGSLRRGWVALAVVCYAGVVVVFVVPLLLAVVVSSLLVVVSPGFLPSSRRFLPPLVISPLFLSRFPSPGCRRFLPCCRFPRFPLLLSSFPPPIVPPSSFGPPPPVIALIALHLRLSFALAVLVVRSRGSRGSRRLYRSSLSSLAFALAVLVVHLVVLFVLVVRPRRPCRSPRRPCRASSSLSFASSSLSFASSSLSCLVVLVVRLVVLVVRLVVLVVRLVVLVVGSRRLCCSPLSSSPFALVVLAVCSCRPRRSSLLFTWSSSSSALVVLAPSNDVVPPTSLWRGEGQLPLWSVLRVQGRWCIGVVGGGRGMREDEPKSTVMRLMGGLNSAHPPR
jgi:hypothetical protein